MQFIYCVFVFLSLFLPRKKDLWVFGNQKGYVDNTRYFFEYASEKNKIRCIWLANSENEQELVSRLGYESYIKKSFNGVWLSSRAGFSFICNGFSDVNRLLALRGKVINFWHGTPIKKVYLDSESLSVGGAESRLSIGLSRFLMKCLNRFITFYYASNSLEQTLVTRAARLPIERSANLGSPRFDYIRSLVSQKKKDLFCSKFGCKEVFLYAPTWRENGVWSEAFTIRPDVLSMLLTVLKDRNAILIIQRHPLTSPIEVASWNVSGDRIYLSSDIGFDDINEIYPLADVLITDVSSAVYDFLILNKPIVFFMPDISLYLQERGIYDYFKKVLADNALVSWRDVAIFLRELSLLDDVKWPDIMHDVALDVANKHGVCEAIYSDILNRFDFH